MTVTFKLGGGIDLKFLNEKNRDLWFDMINKVWDLAKTQGKQNQTQEK